MILLHLYLAHLIADFPLQPMPLVEWKHKSLWGVFVHSLIHLATMVVITIPFIGTPGLYAVLLGIFVIHFFVDAIKVEAEKHTNKQLELFCWISLYT
ncbi:DUF3307 domain-containing protein [Candidatus Peregrinibacteria bacterium]|nr:DUF3307 domain-containing protein [Candidatus Peregrinibacteria bacterium]